VNFNEIQTSVGHFFVSFVFWTTYDNFYDNLSIVTLALGSRPRQGFARLRAKREVGSHTTYSWDCEKV
jgi:hypothetical protein